MELLGQGAGEDVQALVHLVLGDGERGHEAQHLEDGRAARFK